MSETNAFRGLRLTNTLTRAKEDFVPIDPANVRMYVCGPTVYDFAHIGNARPVIVFDVLFRLLRHVYGAENVTYVRNITDVDDKINARATRDFPGVALNEAIRRLTETTADQYARDTAALGCLEPSIEPRATDNIAEMIAMIERLVEKGHAYVSGGEVLFSVPSMPDYGQLSGRNLEDNLAGARIAVEAHKHHPADFVLWKLSSPEEPGWDSPWGRGRPGWHIECSAMSERYLGTEFDIHGGGLDLIFPHHENEIAQSRCAHGTELMARYWLHNGFLQVEGEKMSKSLGNFVTIRDLLDDWPGEVVRFNMLRTHYRQPMDWTVTGLREAERTLANWYELAGDAEPGPLDDEALAALADDLNTPGAFAALHELRSEAARGNPRAASRLLTTAQLMGLLRLTPAAWNEARRAVVGLDEDLIAQLVAARVEARQARDFAEADRIRGELDAMGIVVKDAKDAATGELVTTWEVRR